MANPENLIGQGFHTNPDRINKEGRPKGSRNRSTIVRELLDAIAEGETTKTNADMASAAVLLKALGGDVQAYKELMDSAFGKNPDVLAGDPEAPLNTALNISFVGKKDD